MFKKKILLNKTFRMNQSDDDIFGRNIDQLDRETPRYNLSEEEDDDENRKNDEKLDDKTNAKIIEKKTPSVASVQPYSPATTQSKPVMSPHPVKKGMTSSDEIATHPHTSQYYSQRYPMNSYATMQNFTPARPLMDQGGPRPSIRQTAPKMLSQMGMTRSPHPRAAVANLAHSDHQPMRQSIEHSSMHNSAEQQHHMRQHHVDGAPTHIHTPFVNQLMNPPPRMMGPPPQDQRLPCYCSDCMHPPTQGSMTQLLVIKTERQKIEDEILLRQRELDSCWQEDEVDCPRDFTADDRKKEHFYAKRRAGETGDQEQELLKARETKTSAAPTPAYSTTLSRSTHSAATPGKYTGSIIKTKAKAVVSPFPRSAPAKEVNINDVVSQFSYSNEPDIAQDYTSNGWPQSEMGSRIPSSERINLSPLCVSAAQSGIQTPVDTESGQKLLIRHQQQMSTAQQQPKQPSVQSLQKELMMPSATPSQQLPGHEKKRVSVLDKFKGNEQYQRPRLLSSNQSDSVKDYTSSRWPQSEMGSRIPSSERINLSPLTMSGAASAVQSGLQTPAEANTGLIPLHAQMNHQDNVSTSSANSDSLERKTSAGPIPLNNHQVETPDPTPQQDGMQDYSMFPQSELGSRIPSVERICLSPLCQSELPSGRQSPVEPADVKSAPPTTVNENGVVLRPKKEKSKQDPKLNDIVTRMNITDGRVPRFNYQEEYSAQNYAQPEQSSRMQSYENLVFTPSWSANTSGLVTPCDHSSLYGGAKPLRQQPVLEESEDDLNDVGNQSSSSDQAKNSSDNTDNNQSRLNDGTRYDQVQNAPPVSSATANSQSRIRQPYLAVNGEPISQSNSFDKSHGHVTQDANQRRRGSWSSGGSTASNISTVVNASYSIHNTAPGSPDPDGSEDEESDVSNSVINDTCDFSESYTQASSPPPIESKKSILKPTLLPPQRRWAPKNAVHGPRKIPPPTYPSNQQPDLSDINYQPVNENMKKLIQLAKESFPKTQSTQNVEYTYPEMEELNHRRVDPPVPRHIRPTFQQSNYSDYRYTQRFHPPSQQQQIYGNYQNYHATGHHLDAGYSSHYGYQNRMRPPVDMHQQHGYHMTNLHQRMPIHPLYPPRMHPIPERDIFQHQMINNHQQIFYQQHNHAKPPTNDSRPSAQENHADKAQTGGHFQHHQQRAENPEAFLEARGFFDKASGLQHLSHDKNRTHPTGDNEDTVDNAYEREKRTFSITSLEPNRASPPQNEGLDTISVVSFSSVPASNQNIDTKVDMMSSLLSMLGTHDPDDMARTLLAMSSSADSCSAMRQSGCVPLLINLLHSDEYQINGINWGARQRAGLALHNIVHSNTVDRRGKREVRVLRLLEIIRTHSEAILSKNDESYRANRTAPPLRDHGPGPAVAAIMKLSFEEEHKNTICELGGLQTVAEILAVDYMENMDCHDPYAIALRKYAGMVLINLTYNDAKNKSVLCAMSNALNAIIGQLRFTEEEDLVQVFAGIIRNISWRPDDNTQKALQKVNAVRALMLCLQNLRTEVCIRAVLSAVWNLSAHKSENKEEICRTPGSLKFLTFALSYRSPSKSIVVAENAGGILRNISSHVAVNPEYRKILRQEGCLQTLVSQLRSPSTRVVSNSCGVLWNLSARCVEDQEMLWDLGAVSVLKTLIHSKHKSISASSSAALRNLLAVKPGSGTDSESHLSFNHHRSNSLPTRTRQGIRLDRKTKSPGFTRKYKLDQQRAEQLVSESTPSYFNQYDQERPGRNLNEMDNGFSPAEDNNSPTYNDFMHNIDSLHTHPQVHRRLEQKNEQFFFPSEGRFPPQNRIHKRFDSSSSCSSFSPNETSKRLPFVDVKRHESSESKSELEEKFNRLEILSNDESDEKKVSDSDKTPREEKCVQEVQTPTNPYEDCKLSRASDAVLIYLGTPKTVAKNLKKEKKKVTTPKVISKFKRNPLRKSKENMNSKDSLADRFDAEKAQEKEKSRDKTQSSEEKKENIWVKTKELKQRLLNKSHSSDLAFDKNLMMASAKKTPFDMYSMANFPDRVASDQCLTMTVTDRMYRDSLMNSCQTEMHHGSWSSCDISHSIDEKIAPVNRPALAHTPQPIPKNTHDLQPKDDNQAMAYPLYSPQFIHEYYPNHQNFRSLNRPYHSNQNVYSTSHQPQLSSDSHVECVSENEKTKTKKKSLLKNPLRKSSDGSRKFLSNGKKSEKKKKKSEEKE